MRTPIRNEMKSDGKLQRWNGRHVYKKCMMMPRSDKGNGMRRRHVMTWRCTRNECYTSNATLRYRGDCT